MTLIELIEYAASILQNGGTETEIELQFARFGVDVAVVQEILHTLNSDGSMRRLADELA